MRARIWNDRNLGWSAARSKVLYGVGLLCAAAILTVSAAQSASNSLPEDVAAMRDAILEAAKTGEIEAMGEPIELNELPPDFGGASVGTADALDGLRAIAPDGDGAALLRTIVSILSLPHAQVGSVFVWPYLAKRDPGPLSDVERANLQAVAGQNGLDAVWVRERYVGFQIEIGGDGTWHYLGRIAP